MNDYQLVLDTWEGQGEINEAELLAGGVAGLVIRLNDINGGHHMDKAFQAQWAQAEKFVRWPYFVYNPWVSGIKNYQWLAGNMPAEATAVAADVEVRYAAISSAQYGVELGAFMQLAQSRWKVHIYTGEWFLPLLTPWPRVDYWWAQYPYGGLYPSQRTRLSWESLKTLLDALRWPPLNAAKCPGSVRMWQCSGDHLILPGNSTAMDVSVFPGTLDELRAWVGDKNSSQPPVVNVLSSIEERVAALEAAVREHGWNI
jgi:GH25 family lysozyme M1 (1,4-beta-N-acetylmuramidase)